MWTLVCTEIHAISLYTWAISFLLLWSFSTKSFSSICSCFFHFSFFRPAVLCLPCSPLSGQRKIWYSIYHTLFNVNSPFYRHFMWLVVNFCAATFTRHALNQIKLLQERKIFTPIHHTILVIVNLITISQCFFFFFSFVFFNCMVNQFGADLEDSFSILPFLFQMNVLYIFFSFSLWTKTKEFFFILYKKIKNFFCALSVILWVVKRAL